MGAVVWVKRPDMDDHSLIRHQNRVYAFARSVMPSDAEAADVTQDVLIKLWKHDQNPSPASETAWIYRVTRNACLDALRKRRSRLRWSEAADTLDDFATTDATPDTVLEQHDLSTTLRRAVEALDEPFRSLVILRDMHGLAYAEIAEALEMPLSSVKVYLHRARLRLRESCRHALQEHLNQPYPIEK